MSKKVLTPGNVQAILRMRAIKDEWGEPRYTGTEIAVELGVSDSTVWRVIRGEAAYAKKAPLSTRESADALDRAFEAARNAPLEHLDAAAQSSLERLQADITAAKTGLQNKALEELSPEAAARAKAYLGETK